MNRIILSLGVASALGLAGAASAAEPLTYAQMDAITAGGNAAATAIADAFGVNTSAATATLAQQIVLGVVVPQLGKVSVIQSTATAASTSAADATSIAGASSAGVTVGDVLSDTVSASATLASSVVPTSVASASNTALASTMIRGLFASASSASGAAAQLKNP